VTFSIVAFDESTGELGIAVQSKFIAVGAVVPWAKARVGAIATQSFANTSYGAAALELLQTGMHPQEVSARLTERDSEREKRQFGLVDAAGRAATYTGGECFAWAGGVVGEGFCAQGNILAGPGVIEGMTTAFRESAGTLAERLIAALHGGQRRGGDRRGMQSASLLVVKEKGGYGGFNDRYIDLRVDDHPDPIRELERLLGLYRLYFRLEPQRMRPIDEPTAQQIQDIAARAGYYRGPLHGAYDDATRAAFKVLMHTENLEERWSEEAEVDESALAFLRSRFGT
jgi:uncharacterized Ntn-hydrolase superfamily protein